MTNAFATCPIVMESWGALAKRIESDPSPDAIQRGLELLGRLIASLVDTPEQVSLVVPLNLEAALQRRYGGASYTTARGSGTVVAKTIRGADGVIEILIDVGVLCDVDEAGEFRKTAAGQWRMNDSGFTRMRHFVTHEAQHAVMMQHGSGFDAYDVAGRRSEWPTAIYITAAQMCDEHRAEWSAIRLSPSDPTTPTDIEAVFSSMGYGLAAAHLRYQSSDLTGQDQSKQFMDVIRACKPFWISMAYWAAEFRNGDDIPAVEPTIENLRLWQRYVGTLWSKLGEALRSLPVADLQTSPDVLIEAAEAVASWLQESLNQIGFHIGKGSGDSVFFDIKRDDFPT